MKLITQQMRIRTEIRSVAKRWELKNLLKDQTDEEGEKAKEIQEKLNALDKETATADDVAAIIGNDKWLYDRFTCNECDKKVSVAVQVGEEPDYESSTAILCYDCIKKAFILMLKERKVKP